MTEHVIVTGADGCVGTALLKLLNQHQVRTTALVHAADQSDLAEREARLSATAGGPVSCQPIELTQEVAFTDADDAVLVHGAGITNFKVSAERAKQVNVEGARKVFDAAAAGGVRRVVALGSLYASGLEPGLVAEGPLPEAFDYANHYERSKWEIERLFVDYSDRFETTMLRPGTVFTDDDAGTVSFANAVHHSLALAYIGLLPILPAQSSTPLYLVTAEQTARAILAAIIGPNVGWANVSPNIAAAITIGELVDSAFTAYAEDADFKRRRTPKPLYADMDTFNTFADAMGPLADPLVAGALRSLRPFAPQMHVTKDIENTVGLELAGGYAGVRPTDVESMCHYVLEHGFPTKKPRRA
ncbi:MAG TPA: SDR family oxidoreductase [Marmoricola sp.]|nr:SDR family oxidoreductase [Marmoricola sp.]